MKILLVCSHFVREKIFRYDASESMILGLEEAGIDYDIYRPWDEFTGELSNYDVVLIWSYQGKRRNFIYWSKRFEARCREAGLPIVNSVDGCFYTHSTPLRRWSEAGIPCAKHQLFRHFDEIDLQYPMILRTDELHEGKNTFLVRTPRQAQKIIVSTNEKYWRMAAPDKANRLLDIAIEYHDFKAPDGFYHKRRTIVVGDRLVHREHSASRNWLVNLENRLQENYSQKLNRRFFNNEQVNEELIVKAAKALGSDIIALDYTVLPNGEHFFWEGNRHFKMHGNRHFKSGEYNPITGLSYSEMKDLDSAPGRHIAKLLLKVSRESKQKIAHEHNG